MLLIKILKHLGKIIRVKFDTSINSDTSIADETQFSTLLKIAIIFQIKFDFIII